MYKIKYAIIEANIIENTIQPAQERIDKMKNWFEKLEESILKEGIKNPVVINAKKDGIKSCYGGSRIMIAQKHGLKIPAIIADFDNIFPDAEVLTQPTHIIKKFFTPPAKIRQKPHGISISGCKDIHIIKE